MFLDEIFWNCLNIRKVSALFFQNHLFNCVQSLMFKSTVVFDPISNKIWNFLSWKLLLPAKKCSNIWYRLICFADTSGSFCYHAFIRSLFQINDLGFSLAPMENFWHENSTNNAPMCSFWLKRFPFTCIAAHYGTCRMCKYYS